MLINFGWWSLAAECENACMDWPSMRRNVYVVNQERIISARCQWVRNGVQKKRSSVV